MIDPTPTDVVLKSLHTIALLTSDAFKMAQRFVDVGGELPISLLDASGRATCVWLATQLNKIERQTDEPRLARQKYWRQAFGSSIQKRWFSQ